MIGATHKARLADDAIVFFKVEEQTPDDFLADAMVQDGESFSDSTGRASWSHGPTPEDAVRAFYQPGVVREVVPVDEPFRAELLKLWEESLNERRVIALRPLGFLYRVMKGVPVGSPDRVWKNGEFLDALNDLERKAEQDPKLASLAASLLAAANTLGQEILNDGDAWAAFYRGASLTDPDQEKARARYREGFELQVATRRSRTGS